MTEVNAFNEVVGKIDPYKLYRTREVAEILRCSVRYVQILVELGRLEALHVGRLIRIPGQELVRFIDKYKEWDG